MNFWLKRAERKVLLCIKGRRANFLLRALDVPGFLRSFRAVVGTLPEYRVVPATRQNLEAVPYLIPEPDPVDEEQ